MATAEAGHDEPSDLPVFGFSMPGGNHGNQRDSILSRKFLLIVPSLSLWLLVPVPTPSGSLYLSRRPLAPCTCPHAR